MTLLRSYDWPGNCRELANIIEHAVIFCRGRVIDKDSLPPQIRTSDNHSAGLTLNLATSTLADAESALIKKVLEESNWNLKKAADILDIARGTLYGKIEKYHLTKPV
jgi:two-component system NtrC family response regulator/two-component system response regulator HydG